MELRPSGRPPFWPPGRQIMWRFRRKVPGYEGPETVHPVTVVRDDDEGLVAWLAAGTPVLRPVLPDGAELRSVGTVDMFTAGRAALRDRWRGPGILKIAPTGMPWSMLVFSEPRGWYVNLEDVHQRSADAVYTQDHVLDVWVDANRNVAWKDEDELEAAVRAGRYTRAAARQFQADAEAVVERIDRWESPFCDGWEHWIPNPAWPVPALPLGEHWDFDRLRPER